MFNSNFEFFFGLMENNSTKFCSIGYAIIASMIVLPFVFTIIWFEKYGSDKKRTLINMLVSSSYWSVIQAWFLVYLPDMVRFSFGPLPQQLCFFFGIFRHVIIVEVILFLDSIAIVR